MSAKKFKLDTQLQADSFPVLALPLNDVLLINDSRYLWCVLVPRLTNLRDLHDVPAKHKMTMHVELDRVSVAVKDISKAYKINVAALGNMVEQLHVHVIARHQNDAAWPAPIWGVGKPEPYQGDSASALIRDLRSLLG